MEDKRSKLAELTTNAKGWTGVAAITYGTWAIYHPAGWIVGGLALVAWAIIDVRVGS